MLDATETATNFDAEYTAIMDQLLSIRCALTVINERELLSDKDRALADQAWHAIVGLDWALRDRLGNPPPFTSRIGTSEHRRRGL